MVYMKMVHEALSILRSALLACGRSAYALQALHAIESFIRGYGDEDGLEYAVEALIEAAQQARVQGCLEWYRFEDAARVLEQALG